MLIKGAVYVQESISSRVTKCATFGFKTEVQKCHFNQGEKRYTYCTQSQRDRCTATDVL